MSQLLDNLQQTIYQHSRLSATALVYLLTCSIEDSDDGDIEEWSVTLRTLGDGGLEVWEGRMGFAEIEAATNYQSVYDAIISRPSLKIIRPKAGSPTLVIHVEDSEPLRIHLQSTEGKGDLQALFNLTTSLVTEVNNRRKPAAASTPIPRPSESSPPSVPQPRTPERPTLPDLATQKRIEDLQRQLDAANNVAKTLSQQAAATQQVRKPVTPVKLPGNSSKLQPGRKVHVKHPEENEFATDSDSD